MCTPGHCSLEITPGEAPEGFSRIEPVAGDGDNLVCLLNSCSRLKQADNSDGK